MNENPVLIGLSVTWKFAPQPARSGDTPAQNDQP